MQYAKYDDDIFASGGSNLHGGSALEDQNDSYIEGQQESTIDGENSALDAHNSSVLDAASTISASQTIMILVPKTDGALLVDIRHMRTGDVSGFFVSKIHPTSIAAKQKLLHSGDEIISIDYQDIRHLKMSDVVNILRSNKNPAVLFSIRRQEDKSSIMTSLFKTFSGVFSLPASVVSIYNT